MGTNNNMEEEEEDSFRRAPTCDEQRVHARRRLGGLEHLADVLLREGGLAPALPLGVLLLPPLEVLLGDGSTVASIWGRRRESREDERGKEKREELREETRRQEERRREREGEERKREGEQEDRGEKTRGGRRREWREDERGNEALRSKAWN